MEKEIKSSLINSNNINCIQSKETINSNNDCSLELEVKSNKKIEKEKAKGHKLDKAAKFLQKLLKDTLDQRLTLCEKKSKNHFFIIQKTSEISNSMTNLAIKMNKQIQEKIKKNKERRQSKLRESKYGLRNRKGLSQNKSIISKTQSNFYRVKTSSHRNKIGSNINNKIPILGTKKELIKNKSNNILDRSSKSSFKEDRSSRRKFKRKSLGSKKKSRMNLNNNESNLDELHTLSNTLSITSIKNNKINISILKTINNSITKANYLNRNSNNFKKANTEVNLKQNFGKDNDIKFKKIFNKKIIDSYTDIKNNKIWSNTHNINLNNLIIDDKKIKRKKTPFKKRNTIDNERFNKNINNRNILKKEKTIEDEIDDILSMENNLQKENFLNNNDPLLILPLDDLDFVPKGLLRKYNPRTERKNKEKNFINPPFDVQQNLEKINFKEIFKYMDLDEILSIKNISKEFHRLAISYLLEKLENEKLNILIIKDKLNISEIPNRKGIENIILSKGSKKAIQLLNESLLNNLFKNDKTPVDDIILIYRIYFQMINHPFALIAKNDITKFWEKCKLYFSNEQKGRTGDILNNMFNEKQIEIKGNNLYQIYNLAKENFNKIVPNYYSNICGTTGLFSFVIKDVLDFLGISQKIKNKENAFWTYTDIIESINQKIYYLKSYDI